MDDKTLQALTTLAAKLGTTAEYIGMYPLTASSRVKTL